MGGEGADRAACQIARQPAFQQLIIGAEQIACQLAWPYAQQARERSQPARACKIACGDQPIVPGADDHHPTLRSSSCHCTLMSLISMFASGIGPYWRRSTEV